MFGLRVEKLANLNSLVLQESCATLLITQLVISYWYLLRRCHFLIKTNSSHIPIICLKTQVKIRFWTICLRCFLGEISNTYSQDGWLVIFLNGKGIWNAPLIGKKRPSHKPNNFQSLRWCLHTNKMSWWDEFPMLPIYTPWKQKRLSIKRQRPN